LNHTTVSLSPRAPARCYRWSMRRDLRDLQRLADELAALAPAERTFVLEEARRRETVRALPVAARPVQRPDRDRAPAPGVVVPLRVPAAGPSEALRRGDFLRHAAEASLELVPP
jgi:hypothetical protein